MTDAQTKQFLKDAGYPEHVWRNGKKGLIERWEKFVQEVEKGYSLNLEDYRNDLDLRAIIAKAGLSKDVAEADKRFRRQLVFSAEPIWECDDPDAFWIFGYPRNAKGDLRRDLKSEGLL